MRPHLNTLSYAPTARQVKLTMLFTCATALAALVTPFNATAGWRPSLKEGERETIIRPVQSDTCVNTADTAAGTISPFIDLLEMISSLPLTGAPIAANLRHPARRYQLCVVEKMDADTEGLYHSDMKRIEVAKDSVGHVDIDTVLHESFHAYQDAMGADVPVGTSIAPQDIGVANLLTEATAHVYPLLVFAEARFENPAAFQEAISESNEKRTLSTVERIFEETLTKSYAAHAHLDETARKAAALQEAGRTTVDAMLAGHSSEWSKAYQNIVINSMTIGDATAKTQSRKYRRDRTELLRRAGMISTRISITPLRFLEENVDATIKQALFDNGIEVFSVPKPAFIFGQRR